MDRIQIEFRCCGHYSYEDWFGIENLAEYGSGYVPFSCCSPQSLRPCSHENVPTMELLVSEGEDKSVLKEKLSIYYIGCKYPMEKYYKTMLDWVMFISGSAMTIQVHNTLRTKFTILKTSFQPKIYNPKSINSENQDENPYEST